MTTLRLVSGALITAFWAAAVEGQSVAWVGPSGIAGDANLSTAGAYFDALMLNTGAAAPLSAEGISFNLSTNMGGSAYGNGKISYNGTNLSNYSWPNAFPASASASAAFAAVMDAGGVFQNGGTGTGAVTMASLTVGHIYSVQVFNYANDGDPGLTSFSGTKAVTLNNLPGAGGAGTYGEFGTGIFTATRTSETFAWAGAGSKFTVVGAISVRDVTPLPAIFPSNNIYQGDAATLTVGGQPIASHFQWQTDNGSGGASWSNVGDATSTNYVLATTALAAGNYQFKVAVTNNILNVTSAPVTMSLLPASAPVILQNPTPASANPYVGQSALFTAWVTGNHPISNQWQVSHDGGNTFSNLPGQTGATLTLGGLQMSDAGQYRVAAANAYGSNQTAAATLTVRAWSAARIQWLAPVTCAGLSAGEMLTNVPGNLLEAATFFSDNSAIGVNAGTQQLVFRSDGKNAFISGSVYDGGTLQTNAICGSGAWGTNSTGDANLDAVLDEYFDGGFTNLITLRNLVAGQQYSVQLFALDNRAGNTGQTVSFCDFADPDDVSATLAMGGNDYVVGTFVASSPTQVIQENLLSSGGFGNINAAVVRALTYTPAVAPTIATQPGEAFSLPRNGAVFRVLADGEPTPAFQWKAGPPGGPYTNLFDGERCSGAATPTLTVFGITTNDVMGLVVAVTNRSGGLVSAPVTLRVPAVAQPTIGAQPVRITCVGASDVSAPTPYGTPNWPEYLAPLLGYAYVVTNCGASGTTMMKNGNAPYWNTGQFKSGTNSAPDIVIIMLGSNDAKAANWVNQTNYIRDYTNLISVYRNLPSHPRIYLNTLLTVYNAGNYGITDPIVTGQLCPIIKQIAFDEQLPIIDINGATKNMPQNFPDNVHPSAAGDQIIAQTIFNALMNAGETPPLIDLALNRPVAASSAAGTNAATYAVDNDYSTPWSSAATDNEWIYADLGSEMKLSAVCLRWGAAYGQSYKIQVSNDAANWTDVRTNNAGAGGIDRLSLNAAGRYVRMLGLHSGTGGGYSLLDFTVVGPQPAPLLKVAPAGGNQFQLWWKASSIYFQVDTSTDLTSPANWVLLRNDIGFTNGSNFTTLGSPGSGVFFRLKQRPID